MFESCISFSCMHKIKYIKWRPSKGGGGGANQTEGRHGGGGGGGGGSD